MMVQWPSVLLCVSSWIKFTSQRALCPHGERKGRWGETGIPGGAAPRSVFFIGSGGSVTYPRALHVIESTDEAHVVCSSAQYRRLSLDYNTKLVALTYWL